MKAPTILILTLGLASVIADPILIGTTSSNKKPPCPILSGNSESEHTSAQYNKDIMEKIVSELNSVDNTPARNKLVIEEMETAINSADDNPTNTEVVENIEAASDILNDLFDSGDDTPINTKVVENIEAASDLVNDLIPKNTVVIGEIETAPNSGDTPKSSEVFENIEAASDLVNDKITKNTVVIEKTEPALDLEDDTPTKNIVIIEKTENPSNSADDKPTKKTMVIEKVDVQPNLIDDTSSFGEGVVEIVIRDNAAPPTDMNIATPLEVGDSTNPFENIFKSQSTINEEFSVPNYLYRNNLQSRIASEIMAAAKGFAPLPLFSIKRKQNTRRRFAIRRRYNAYPHRRRFNSFYPYYAFYRPSSLRYY